MITMQSDIFDFPRFGHLVARDWRLNRNRYLLYTSAVLAILVINSLFVMISYSQLEPSFRINQFVINIKIIMFVSGCLWASSAFSDMSTRSRRAVTLTFPASITERFILQFITTVPAFIVVFAIGMWIAGAVYSLTEETGDISVIIRESEGGIYNFIQVVNWFLFAQSLFFLGATLWHRLSAVKTFAFASIIIVIYAIISSYTCDIVNLTTQSKFFTTRETVHHIKMVIFVLFITGTLFNYAVAYIKFRESDIIDHW